MSRLAIEWIEGTDAYVLSEEDDELFEDVWTAEDEAELERLLAEPEVKLDPNDWAKGWLYD